MKSEEAELREALSGRIREHHRTSRLNGGFSYQLPNYVELLLE
jgi:hypothetical protein